MKNNQLIEQELDRLMIKVKDNQMTREEYAYISSFFDDGPKNFLVFGTGYDTSLWKMCNIDGYSLFLEHDDSWIDPNDKHVLRVEYNCNLGNADKLLEEFKKGNTTGLEINIPSLVSKTAWDLIFVDAPPGNKPHTHGRMQSIYTALKICQQQPNIVEVFVHDCDRPVEDKYTTTMFPYLVKQLMKLRHVRSIHQNEMVS